MMFIKILSRIFIISILASIQLQASPSEDLSDSETTLASIQLQAAIIEDHPDSGNS